MDDTDLATRLDRSIGPAPESDDALAALLATGHGAVRRRRVGAGVAAVVAVVVVAGGTALLTGGDGGRATAPLAGTPSTTSASPSAASTSPGPTAPPPTVPGPTVPASGPWPWGRELAALDFEHGELEIRPGATVLQRLDNPYHLDPPRGSAAVEVTRHGKTLWYAFAWERSGSSSAISPADPTTTFRAWVDEMSTIAATEEEGATDPTAQAFPGRPADDLVVFAADHGELLNPVEGAVVLDRREGVDVGPSFASAGDDTAAAEVRAPDGRVFYVLARRTPGSEPQYIAVPQAKGGADLDAFLAFARERYADGGGGLL